jgi:rSAM/selenodomain-associated transferase 2
MADPLAPTLSIVIPCWNDAAALENILSIIASLRGVTEVIVADASETARSRTVAKNAGAKVVLCDRPHRGAQMNAGAALAAGEVILFQHADTALTQAHVDALLTAMGQNPRLIGGAFHRKFDARHPLLLWLEPIARKLSNMGGTLYGDQSIFVRRDHFKKMGGFAVIPLMEDIEFSRRLRRSGITAVLDPPIATSARRHCAEGAWKASLQNAWLIFLYRLGVSPSRLHDIYYHRRGPGPVPQPADATAAATMLNE